MTVTTIHSGRMYLVKYMNQPHIIIAPSSHEAMKTLFKNLGVE